MTDVRDAPAPFNNPRADVILRTCDAVDHRVRSSILAEASSVFEDMFDIAREAPTQQCPRKAGLPVVAIAETSEVTDFVLRLCYPMPAPTFTTFAQVRAALAAVDKYIMEGPLETLKKHLTDFELEGAHPLLVFITAYTYGFEEVARLAAQKSIGQPLQGVYYDGLENMNAGVYCRLLRFHQAGDANALLARPFLSADLAKASARPPLASYSREEWVSKSTSPYPFGMPSADMTLRTCDGFEFKVHSDLLQLASPYLRIMLTTGSPPTAGWERNEAGQVCAIALPEHSRTVATVLQYIYPVEHPVAPVDAHTASVALKAAKRYQFTAAVGSLEACFLGFAEAEPLVAYAIACAHRWASEARHAALMAMRKPLGDRYVEELEEIPATCYYHLLEHRDALGKEVASCVLYQIGNGKTDPLRISEGQKEPFVWTSCRSCAADNLLSVFYIPKRKWWCDWLRQVATLLESVPSGQTVLDEQAFVAAMKTANTCTTCGSIAAIHLHRFAQILSERVDDMLSQKKSSLSFW